MTPTKAQLDKVREISAQLELIKSDYADRESRDAIQFAIDTLTAQEECAWQLIETAPRDGTKIIGFSTGDDFCEIVSYSYGCFDIVGKEDLEYRPTHWMPLPPTPTNKITKDIKS